ncbi:MAG: tetratricopeptide repeat protein [Rhodothermales bacterium]|nr:tetratricopeptide repeat protein [Rhodothermales bacterium]
MKLYCKACGGALKPDDERCFLCGTPAGVDPDELDRVEVTQGDASGGAGAETGSDLAAGSGAEDPNAGDAAAGHTAAATGGAAASRPVFCHSCGWKNPPASKFCAQCGTALQQLEGTEGAVAGAATAGTGAGTAAGTGAAAAMPAGDAIDRSPPGQATGTGAVEEGVGKRVGIIVGSAVMIVLALYLISALNSQQSPPSGPQPPPEISTEDLPPVPVGIAQQIEILDDSLAAGADPVPALERKVGLYLSAGRYDLAAQAQEEFAQAVGTEDAWTLAGNLYYDSMDRQPDGTELRTAFAKQAIAAYRKVLEINPDNLDVRTDMAVAYLWDPDNPMSAIQETQAVLERDSMHVQANFNRGIMLSQIGRMDQAIEQFRKVQRIVGDPESDLHQRADAAIASLTGGQ